jgi:hypothetical protein
MGGGPWGADPAPPGIETGRKPIRGLDEKHVCMSTSWMLTLGIIFLIIAIVLMALGFVGKVAWKIGKWLIILFIVLAFVSWVSTIF